MTSMTKHSDRADSHNPGRRQMTDRAAVWTIARGMREWAENPPAENAAKVSLFLMSFAIS